MSNIVEIVKSDDEVPVPSSWRGTFAEIVQAFRRGDFSLKGGIPGVVPVSQEDADLIERSISAYGSELSALPAEAWDTSVCRWTGAHWDVLVDIFTIDEGLSDLVLFSKVREHNGSYVFEVQSVHVP